MHSRKIEPSSNFKGCVEVVQIHALDCDLRGSTCYAPREAKQDSGPTDSVQDQAGEPTGELHRLWRGRRRERQDLAWHTTRATEAELEHATAIAHNNPTRWPGRLGSSISPRSDVRKPSCDSRRSSQPAQPLQPTRRPAGHEVCTVRLSTYCSETRTVDPPQRHITDMSLFSHSTRSKRELASCRVQCWRAISLGY